MAGSQSDFSFIYSTKHPFGTSSTCVMGHRPFQSLNPQSQKNWRKPGLTCVWTSLFRRCMDTQMYTEPVLLKYGKLTTKYPWIYRYILQYTTKVLKREFLSTLVPQNSLSFRSVHGNNNLWQYMTCDKMLFDNGKWRQLSLIRASSISKSVHGYLWFVTYLLPSRVFQMLRQARTRNISTTWQHRCNASSRCVTWVLWKAAASCRESTTMTDAVTSRMMSSVTSLIIRSLALISLYTTPNIRDVLQ